MPSPQWYFQMCLYFWRFRGRRKQNMTQPSTITPMLAGSAYLVITKLD